VLGSAVSSSGHAARERPELSPMGRVLMDLHMPGMNDIEATRRLLAECQR
jgi:CheY-like chemotaxis protein